MGNPGHFPSADPATHLRSVPYARALGLAWEDVDGPGVRIRLPWSARVSDREGLKTDRGAMLGLIDHACSAAVYRNLDHPTLIATLDLRVETAANATAGSNIVCDAQALHDDGVTALVRAEARCATSGRVVAYASSTYAIGTHPGKRSDDVAATPRAPEPDTARLAGLPGFAALLGLRLDRPRPSLPFAPHLIGAISLPSLHGGTTGAAMAACALAAAHAERPEATVRLVSAGIQYLRAAAARDTTFTLRWFKRGRLASVAHVLADQGDTSRPVAHAECVFSFCERLPERAE